MNSYCKILFVHAEIVAWGRFNAEVVVFVFVLLQCQCMVMCVKMFWV